MRLLLLLRQKRCWVRVRVRMTLRGNRERYGQGEQKTEKDGRLTEGLLPAMERHRID